MTRWLALSLAIVLTGGLGARDGAGSVHRPLDLPSGGVGAEGDDEDAPETIRFFGVSYEGDAFFWCFDRSNSMSPHINTVKQELNSAISQLSREAEFSVVRFSTGVSKWSSLPKRATALNKNLASTWVNSTSIGGGTCITPAVIQTLEIASFSRKPLRRLILLGDGVPACEGGETTLEDVTNANYESIPIDTIYVGQSEEGHELFQDIANLNDGTFSTPSP